VQYASLVSLLANQFLPDDASPGGWLGLWSQKNEQRPNTDSTLSCSFCNLDLKVFMVPASITACCIQMIPNIEYSFGEDMLSKICNHTTFLQFQGVPSCTIRVVYFKKVPTSTTDIPWTILKTGLLECRPVPEKCFAVWIDVANDYICHHYLSYASREYQHSSTTCIINKINCLWSY